MHTPIKVVKEKEAGMYHVEYFGKIIGWIAKARMAKGETFKYRAVSVHGTLGYHNTINSARCFIISNYH